MAATKLLNLLAISSLAILACSFGATPVAANGLSADNHARHAARGHGAVAKRRRSNDTPEKRCKARPSSSIENSPSSTWAAPASTWSASSSWSSSSKWTAPSSSAAPAPSPSSGGGGSGGSKAGIAWANGDDPSLVNFKTPGGNTPLYTWSPELPLHRLGFDCIPQFWGPDQQADFSRLVVKGYANTVLGFNEPNQIGQSDISAQYGAELWQQYIQPLSQEGYALISPATTSAPSGMAWMKDFFAACNGCTFDGVALHWYDVSADAFIAYITSFHTAFNKPIWVTEFACQNFNGGAQCTQDQVFSFMATITAFMEKTDWVAHYFAFGAMHDMQGVNVANQLMDKLGNPTPLGYAYISSKK